MDNDFLDGINKHLKHLMKLYGNGSGAGRSPSSKSPEDRLVVEIVKHLQPLPDNRNKESAGVRAIDDAKS